MTQAYEEIVEFLAGGTTPQSLIDFRPFDMAKANHPHRQARPRLRLSTWKPLVVESGRIRVRA